MVGEEKRSLQGRMTIIHLLSYMDDILVSKRGHFNEPRNVAIYLIRCIRNDMLKGVGKVFVIDKNSTVGSVVQRVKREMEKNKNISKRVENLKDILEKS